MLEDEKAAKYAAAHKTRAQVQQDEADMFMTVFARKNKMNELCVPLCGCMHATHGACIHHLSMQHACTSAEGPRRAAPCKQIARMVPQRRR
jgi:hypothetical protein